MGKKKKREQEIEAMDSRYSMLIFDMGDVDAQHRMADQVLCMLLEELGFVKVIKKFNDLNKRY